MKTSNTISQARGIHNGQRYERKAASTANPDRKAVAKLAQRRAQHMYACAHATKQRSCMEANIPGSLNRRNH